MMTRLLLFSALLASFPEIAADIAPNPIQAKGIVSSGSFEIVLKWERVVVDLYKDSSVVECQFFLKNNGKGQKVNIGFPEMNFYHFNFWNKYDQLPGTFVVHENGNAVDRIEFFRPDSQNHKSESEVPPNLVPSTQDNYSEKPWLLWDSQFEEFATKLITVRYSLPHGTIRNRSRYFTYLLSTGSGWKGNIDSAEIIVNLKDIEYDLILEAAPASYTRDKNQLKWLFTEFEPTTENDIRIMYEPVKGDYERLVAKYPSPIWFIDGAKVTGAVGLLEPGDIASMKVLKDSKDKAKYSSGNEDVILVTRKDYAIRQFIDQIISKKLKTHNIKYLPHSLFITKYDLKIDEDYFEGLKMLQQLPEIVPEDIRRVRLINNDSSRTTIYLMTRKGGRSTRSSSS